MDLSQVMVGVPTRGRINYNTAQRLLELQERYPQVTYSVEASGISSAHTRHMLIRRFLQTECDVLLQVDDDVIPPMTVFNLAESTYDLTGGVYLIIMANFNIPFPGAFKWVGTSYAPIDHIFGRTGRVPVDGVASGCLAVKRHVYETIKAPFTIPYSEDGVATGSDDLAFCSKAREAGFTIAADFGIWCDHLPDGASLNRAQEQYFDAFVKARAIEKDRLIVSG